MHVWIIVSAARQSERGIIAQAVIGGIEAGMLPREEQRRRDADVAERLGDWGELDSFGTSADDENNAAGQPSP